MILRALTLGLCLAGLTACSASQNLLARGVAVAVDDDSVVPKTAQGFPPRFAALVQDTATPALLLTVENRAQTGRMLREARAKGFTNTLTCDVMGNVAETATANVFMVKDGEVFTPIANGTFLAGITRARHIENMRADGIAVHETVLSYAHFESADEIFLSGNMSKVTPVTAFDDVSYQHGSVTRRVRELYWDWAKSGS